MTERSDVVTDRDPELAALLHDHLAVGPEGPFVARVLARIRADGRESSWDILARWAPLGMAAAVLLALGVGLWLGGEVRQWRTPSAAPIVASGTMAQWVTSPGPVTNDIVLAAVLDGDRWYGSTSVQETPR